MEYTQDQLLEALRMARMAYWEFDPARDSFLFNDHFYALLRTSAEREGGYAVPFPEYVRRVVHPDDAARVRRLPVDADHPVLKQILDPDLAGGRIGKQRENV